MIVLALFIGRLAELQRCILAASFHFLGTLVEEDVARLQTPPETLLLGALNSLEKYYMILQ